MVYEIRNAFVGCDPTGRATNFLNSYSAFYILSLFIHPLSEIGYSIPFIPSIPSRVPWRDLGRQTVYCELFRQLSWNSLECVSNIGMACLRGVFSHDLKGVLSRGYRINPVCFGDSIRTTNYNGSTDFYRVTFTTLCVCFFFFSPLLYVVTRLPLTMWFFFTV